MRRPSATHALAALALFACSSSHSTEPGGVLREPIVGGELDRDHNEVVELITEFDGGVGLCTGTLVAQNLVLTARHCVARRGGGAIVRCGSSPFSAPVAGSAVHATSAIAPSQSSRFFDGRSVSVPPQGNDTCGFDVALVTLSENVPADVARPAVPRIELGAVTGESYVALGYGVDDLGNDTAGRMRLEGLVVRCSADRCGVLDVAASEFLGESGVCNGDSGGPALDVERRVIGVLSRGSDPCETPVYGEVAAFRDWIMATAIDAAEVGGYDPPYWALSGSSDRPPRGEDDPCASADECGDGFACYYESDPLFAVCKRACAARADCAEPSSCVMGFDAPGGGLCLTPSRPPADPTPSRKRGSSDGSCSIGGGDRSPGSPAVFALVLLSLLACRRRAAISSRVD